MVEVPHIQVDGEAGRGAQRYGLKPGDVRRASAHLDGRRGGRRYFHRWAAPTTCRCGRRRRSRHSVNSVAQHADRHADRAARSAGGSRRCQHAADAQCHQARGEFPSHRRAGECDGAAISPPSRRTCSRACRRCQFPLGYCAVLQGEYQELKAARQHLQLFCRAGGRRHLPAAATVVRQLAAGDAEFPDPAFGAGGRRARGVGSRAA